MNNESTQHSAPSEITPSGFWASKPQVYGDSKYPLVVINIYNGGMMFATVHRSTLESASKDADLIVSALSQHEIRGRRLANMAATLRGIISMASDAMIFPAIPEPATQDGTNTREETHE